MAGRLQNEDFKTEAELTGAGGAASQLLNDTKVYVTSGSINKTLDDAITDGDIGGGGYGVATLQNISASGTITVGTGKSRLLRIQGNGAAVTASSTPFGASPPTNGTVITLVGNDDTNTVTITHNDAADGCVLNGDIEISKYKTLTVVYHADFDRYVEISRS